ncbi:programmed cell death protein 1 [Zootoca vivipara]|uniref:programmed cell death protein 1 n=1 Tax=Zootoca vivipara TaxID=8524 RepID=UPI00293BEC65|nr:programmed cell death protein 1 [Zootoca vivipara]XP_060130253.1 programmed cell death protein 1 [Zootoca vivipara]
MGATARFTCRLSETIQKYSLNWYKLGDDKQPKLLDLGKRKYNPTKLNATTFEIKISDLEMNDSGTYFCALIRPSMELTESNRANLTVTEKQLEPGLPLEATELGLPSEETEPGLPSEEREDHGEILLAVVGGVGLFLVLPILCYYLFNLIQRRQEEEKLQDENAPLEEGPPAVSVFTVDYGVLEFRGADSAQRAPHERFASDQTEYATIIFPPEKTVAAKVGKKTKEPKNCPSRAQPH